MKKKTTTIYICSKCGLQFSTEKLCKKHEEICGTCCDVNLTIVVSGGFIKPMFSIDRCVHTSVSTIKYLYKVNKTGPYNYHCYAKNDDESIRKAKELIVEFVRKEVATLNKFCDDLVREMETQQ